MQYMGQAAWRPVAIRNPAGRRDFPLIGEQPKTDCRAWVCRVCGYTELYTMYPDKLFAE